MSPFLFLKILVVVLLILAIPAAFFGYQAHTNSTAYLMAKGNEAIERLDLKENVKEVERIQKLLEKKGEVQAALLVRGKSLVYTGDAALKKSQDPLPFEELQRASQMVLGGAGLSDQSGAAREVVWISASLFQKPARVSSPASTAFRLALADLAKIQDDGPIGEEGSVLAAECLMRLDGKPLAEKGLKAIVKRHPDNLQAHRLLSVIYIDLNSPGAAVKYLKEWARLEPSAGLPYRWIGFFEKDNNQVGEAIADYEEALQRKLPPDIRAQAIKELAEIYYAAVSDYAKALDTLAKTSEASQRDPDILFLRVECLRGAGRAPEALELVKKALQENPKNLKILVLRAQMYSSEDNPQQALPLVQEAVRIDPYDLPAQMLLMKTYRELKNIDEAEKQKKVVEEVTKIHKRLADLQQQANQHLWDDQVRVDTAAICIQIGQIDRARTWLQAALTCNPNNSKARRLLAQLPPKEKARSMTTSARK
jgi:tetratricopeptide (TPR) repeat protein